MTEFHIEGPNKWRFAEVPAREPESYEIELEMRVLGLCGSDLKTFNGENLMVELPIIPGHEIGALIKKVGSEVPAAYEPGMIGSVLPYTSCGVCPACQSGAINTCTNNRTLGIGRPGAACSNITIPYESFVPAESLSYDELALLEPLSVGVHTAKRAGEVKGRTVLLMGLGIVGIGILKALLKRGADVIVADVSDFKLNLAREFGATYTLNAGGPDFRPRVFDICGCYGPEVCIDAAGAGSVVTDLFELVSVSGRIVFLGYFDGSVPFNTKPIVSKEVTVVGARNARKEDFVEATDMLRSGQVRPNQVVTKRFNFNDIGIAFEYWNKHRNETVKLLIDFN